MVGHNTETHEQLLMNIFSRSQSSDAAADDVSPDDDCNVVHTDEGASVWLESMGLNKKHFPSLDPNKVKLYPCLILMSCVL